MYGNLLGPARQPPDGHNSACSRFLCKALSDTLSYAAVLASAGSATGDTHFRIGVCTSEAFLGNF